MSSTQPQQQGGGKRVLRVLSLDAGGVHSMSTIYILRYIMNKFNEDRPSEEKKQPWDMFDMIGGTETGGLLALMLGRLQMSLDECEEAFAKLCKTIYKPKDRKDKRETPRHEEYVPCKFDNKVLENAIKKMILEQKDPADPEEPDPEEPLGPYGPCKTFVTLEAAGVPDSSRICSSYKRRSDPNELKYCKLVEACAATLASKGFFDPVQITNAEGLWLPSDDWDIQGHSVAEECNKEWPMRESLVISIGAGISPEETVGKAIKQLPARGNPCVYGSGTYFRFNMDRVLPEVLKETIDHINTIQYLAKEYLDDYVFQTDVLECVGRLRGTYASHLGQWGDEA